MQCMCAVIYTQNEFMRQTFYDGRLNTIRLITTVNRTFKYTSYGEKNFCLSRKYFNVLDIFTLSPRRVAVEKVVTNFPHIFHLILFTRSNNT